MSKNELSIDTDIWITQQQLADEMNISIQRVHNWVQRKKIESMRVKELGNIRLVNRNSISISIDK